MKLILLFILIMLSFTAIAVKAAEDAQYGWHDAYLCNPCHNSILSQSSSEKISAECICHYPPENPVWNTNIEIQSIKTIHGSKPCIKCHINSIGTVSKDNLHWLHGTVECENCHGYKDVSKPDFLECSGCHGSEIHGVHDDLDSLCAVCHGEFGADTIGKFESSDLPVSTDLSLLSEINGRKIPTIIDVLKALFQMIKF